MANLAAMGPPGGQALVHFLQAPKASQENAEARL